MKQFLVFLAVLIKLTVSSMSHGFRHVQYQVFGNSEFEDGNNKLEYHDDFETQNTESVNNTACNNSTDTTDTPCNNGTNSTNSTGDSSGSSSNGTDTINSTGNTTTRTGGSSSGSNNGSSSNTNHTTFTINTITGTTSSDSGLSSDNNSGSSSNTTNTINTTNSATGSTGLTNQTGDTNNSDSGTLSTISLSSSDSSSDSSIDPLVYVVAGIAALCLLGLIYLCCRIRNLEKKAVNERPVSGVDLNTSATDFRPNESVFVDMSSGFQVFDRRSDSVIISVDPALRYDSNDNYMF